MALDQVKHPREVALAAASRSLAELLTSDPEALAEALSDAAIPTREGYRATVARVAAEGGMEAVRTTKRRLLAAIAARDTAGELALEVVGAALADLADACLEAALASEPSTGLSVIGMGKLGARELNYFSDIDLVFVCDGDVERATKAASRLIAELGEFSPQGQPYLIDTNLRPEGRNGPLVRSVDACVEYYRRWAKPWEFQALIKARGAAGDVTTGNAFVERTREFVYPIEVGAERVAEIRKMKQRVEEHAHRSTRRSQLSDADDVKLGPGGIRDIEFSVQLLQLVHGGGDPDVRAPATLEALNRLTGGGYIADEDGAGLSVAYRWLRTVEHRLQLYQERRVRHLPRDEEGRARLARTLGFHDSPSASAASRFEDAHRAVLADVRNRFDKLFYRPMVETLSDARGPGLSRPALADRLRVLGFRDVERASQTLAELVEGTSRRAKLFRVLTPALLRYLSETPVPDEGLFQFLVLGESLGSRLDALGALRDNPPGIEFLAGVLGSGRLLGQVLVHVPEELTAIADPDGPGAPKERGRLVREANASLGWREPERRLDGLRRFKRREMLRVALADLAGTADVHTVGRGLSDLADACLEAALKVIDFPLAVIGMGKLGGRELNYASDIDVMFVHDADPMAAERAAEQLLKTIGEVTPEGQAFRIDANLRPEGKSGSLARTIASFGEYYERRARPWEFQALLKARWSAGDVVVGERFIERVRDLAFPEHPAASSLGEIRHLKARMERERTPRGVDPRRDFKMGPGGLADIEFAVQIVQLRHGHSAPQLQVTGTVAALDAASAHGFMDDSEVLRDAYVFLSRLRNRLFFLLGRPTSALPVKPEDLEALGIAMGYRDQPRQQLEEDYLRTTRRARRVAEPLIYG